MSVDVEGTYELDGIEEGEEDPRSPLILEESKRSNTSTFFQFPAVSPRRSILKPRKHHDSAKPSVFLTVPVPGDTAPLPSPIVPTSTPLPVHGLHRVSFYGQQDSLPVEQSVSCPATQFNTTRYKRSQYLSNLLLILSEGLLPLVSIVSTLVNVLELFLTGEQILGWAGLAIFAFPTVLVLFYYLENMFHREKKLLELGLIVIFGPFLRWLCSVRLLSSKLYPASEVTDLDDVQRFAFATKVIDGIFQACIQIIWLLYLIAIEVYPFPMLNMRTKSVTDWFGNNLDIPVFSSLSLYSSLAVLVKNLSQLWRIHYPVSTDQDGSVTLELQPKVEGNCKILFQWFLLVLFTSTGVLYRLISYSLLFLHLNLFMMPAGGIIILSTLLHVILRGVSDKFYVETSKMNVFLTACCCGLVPTPTSSNIRAHNLLQVHNAITNVFLLIAVLFCIFFSIDYSVPIVRRPSRLGYSRDYFFNYCLVAVFLLPISILFYSLFKKTMGYPGLVRKTIFWRNRSPTVVSILTGIVSFFLLVSLAMLNILGRHSSYQCQESTSPVHHGLLVPQATGHGIRLECHQNYRPSPAPVIYCSWFFGQQGVIELEPLYYQELTGAQSAAEKVAFMRNLSTVTCIKSSPSWQDAGGSCPAKRYMDRCNTISLQSTAFPHGSWHCAGENCALFCQPGYLSTGSRTFLCQADNTAPQHYCQLASLAVSNLTHTQTLSLETEDCTSSWEKDTTGHSHDRYKDLVLCINASDILTCNNSCQSLNTTDHHLSFTANSSSRSLVSYSPLPMVNLMVEGGKAVSDSHLSFSWEKECIVKISHDTMLIIGERTLLIKYTGPGANISYWVLPSLQYPRHYHDCILLDGGLVLVAGGKGAWRRNWTLETEMMNINMFNGKNNLGRFLPTWKLVGNLAVPRMRGTLLMVSGGCPLLVGGQGEQGEEVLAVEEFHLHTGNENGKWQEVPLDMNFIPEQWSVAICGNDICTKEKFDAGGPRYNCVEKIPVAEEVKKTTNKPSTPENTATRTISTMTGTVANTSENGTQSTSIKSSTESNQQSIIFTISEQPGNLKTSDNLSSTKNLFKTTKFGGQSALSSTLIYSVSTVETTSITDSPGSLSVTEGISSSGTSTESTLAQIIFTLPEQSGNLETISTFSPLTTDRVEVEALGSLSVTTPVMSTLVTNASPLSTKSKPKVLNTEDTTPPGIMFTVFPTTAEDSTPPEIMSTVFPTTTESTPPGIMFTVFPMTTEYSTPPGMLSIVFPSTTDEDSTPTGKMFTVFPTTTEDSTPPGIMSTVFPTTTESTPPGIMFTVFPITTEYSTPPGIMFTVFPTTTINSSHQPVTLSMTSATTAPIIFTFKQQTEDLLVEPVDEDHQTNTTTTNVDEIDLTIFDLPNNYQDY